MKQESLKSRSIFLVWKYEDKSGHVTKVPYGADGCRIGATPKYYPRLVPYETALNAAANFNGVGFVFVGFNDKLHMCGIDIDHKDPEDEFARAIIALFPNAYIERSPSGKGAHIVLLADLSRIPTEGAKLHSKYYVKNKDSGLECYIAGLTHRYFAFTGDALQDGQDTDQTDDLLRFLNAYMLKDKPSCETAAKPEGRGESILSDEEVLKKARSAAGGGKFARLFDEGDTSAHNNDNSSADMALMNMLAFWTRCDTEQMERLFDRSALGQRDKWQMRADYRKGTVRHAVDNCKDVYEPPHMPTAAEDFGLPGRAYVNPLDDKERYRPSDKGNGYLFADLFADTLRYCPQARGWYIYLDGKWQPDSGDAHTRERAKTVPPYLRRFLSEIEDDGLKKAHDKNVMQLYNLAARERMLKDAQSVNPLRLEDLDANPDWFNIRNGTINPDTRAFKSHSAADLISKKAGAAFNPSATCPLWLKTLDEIFEGKADIIRYFQKILGYSLLGKPVEKEFYILFGRETDNGKTTLIQTVEALMGDYAVNAPPELIAEKRFNDSSRPSGDRARLAGARFLSINEPGRGMRLDEAYVKSITGRDTQTARHLYQTEFQYAVRFVMVVSTNHLPYVSDQTIFKSGRVRVIPFERRFREHEKNKKLIDQLRQPQELSGILNWVLDGVTAYRQEGLSPPPAVVKETKDYERTSDNVMRFLEDCTKEDINGAIQTSTLHKAFEMWCANERVSSMSLKAFSQAVKERGLKIVVGKYNGSDSISHVWGIKCTFSTVQN
jgi:putative DNA primase/helicase